MLQFSDLEMQNVIVMKYKITNISDFDYDKMCFGFYADAGVGGPSSGGDDYRYKKELELVYAWDHQGKGIPGNWSTGYIGFATLETPQHLGLTAVSLVELAYTPSNPWPKNDETVWQKMVGGFVDTSIIVANVNIVFSSGPFSFPKFSTDSITAAIISAANLNELLVYTKITKYFIKNNFTLNSTEGNVSLTLTKPGNKERVSGVYLIQYSLANYTGAAIHYIYHFAPQKGWSLIGKDESNNGYFYWTSNSVKDDIHNQLKIISVTDSAVFAVTSGFFTTQNTVTTKPDLYIQSPLTGSKLAGDVDVKFWGGDADGDACLINFFYKTGVNSIPTLVVSGLKESELSFTWKTNNSANSSTGELIGQIISKADTFYSSIKELNIYNKRSNPYPDTVNYIVDRKGKGTGDISLHLIDPSLITGDDYLVVFDSAYFDRPTLYCKLFNKTKGNTFIGDIFEVQNRAESFLFDGLRIVIDNDRGVKTDLLFAEWVVGNSNVLLSVSHDFSPTGWRGEVDYEIRFSDQIVDTTDIKEGPYVILPINFEVFNITSNYKPKVAMADPDKSGSFSVGDEIRILEYEGTSIKTSWIINYQLSPNPIPPVAGDVFRIVAKKEFVKGDSITFTTSGLVGVRDMDARPSSYSLSQNYPNPFNPATKIQFSVPQNEIVKIKVYDFLGAEIATLVNREMNSGSYEVDFNGKTLASGIYFVRMEAGKFVETKKIVLLK